MGIMQLFDGLQSVLSGVLRACGMQNYGAAGWSLIINYFFVRLGFLCVFVYFFVFDYSTNIFSFSCNCNRAGNIFGYYAISTPLAYVLSFYTDLDLNGVWLGLLCGVVTTTIVFTVLVRRVDWQLVLLLFFLCMW